MLTTFQYIIVKVVDQVQSVYTYGDRTLVTVTGFGCGLRLKVRVTGYGHR